MKSNIYKLIDTIDEDILKIKTRMKELEREIVIIKELNNE